MPKNVSTRTEISCPAPKFLHEDCPALEVHFCHAPESRAAFTPLESERTIELLLVIFHKLSWCKSVNWDRITVVVVVSSPRIWDPRLSLLAWTWLRALVPSRTPIFKKCFGLLHIPFLQLLSSSVPFSSFLHHVSLWCDWECSRGDSLFDGAHNLSFSGDPFRSLGGVWFPMAALNFWDALMNAAMTWARPKQRERNHKKYISGLGKTRSVLYIRCSVPLILRESDFLPLVTVNRNFLDAAVVRSVPVRCERDFVHSCNISTSLRATQWKEIACASRTSSQFSSLTCFHGNTQTHSRLPRQRGCSLIWYWLHYQLSSFENNFPSCCMTLRTFFIAVVIWLSCKSQILRKNNTDL